MGQESRHGINGSSGQGLTSLTRLIKLLARSLFKVTWFWAEFSALWLQDRGSQPHAGCRRRALPSLWRSLCSSALGPRSVLKAGNGSNPSQASGPSEPSWVVTAPLAAWKRSPLLRTLVMPLRPSPNPQLNPFCRVPFASEGAFYRFQGLGCGHLGGPSF